VKPRVSCAVNYARIVDHKVEPFIRLCKCCIDGRNKDRSQDKQCFDFHKTKMPSKTITVNRVEIYSAEENEKDRHGI
jgi:hypothetical protein